MADSVNELMDKLAKIEESAGKMITAAEEEKRLISREHKKRISYFDKELDAEYRKKLNDIADSLKAEAGEEIDRLRTHMKKASDKLDNDYSEKKDRWINEIFEAIIA